MIFKETRKVIFWFLQLTVDWFCNVFHTYPVRWTPCEMQCWRCPRTDSSAAWSAPPPPPPPALYTYVCREERLDVYSTEIICYLLIILRSRFTFFHVYMLNPCFLIGKIQVVLSKWLVHSLQKHHFLYTFLEKHTVYILYIYNYSKPECNPMRMRRGSCGRWRMRNISTDFRMASAMSAISTTWRSSIRIGRPDATMYASPIVSTCQAMLVIIHLLFIAMLLIEYTVSKYCVLYVVFLLTKMCSPDLQVPKWPMLKWVIV